METSLPIHHSASWNGKILLHNDPASLEKSVDITRDIFRGDIPPPSVLRREELLKLVASVMRVSLESLCSWCNQGGQPGFSSRLLPKTPLGEYLGGSGILTPDAPEDVLKTQDEIVSSLGGDALGCHDSLRNWMVDSRVTAVHICSIEVLANSIRRSLPEVTSSLRTASVVYFSRIFPWNAYLDREGPAWLKTPGSLPDIIRDGSVITKDALSSIREMTEQATALIVDPPILPTTNITYVNARLYPCMIGRASPEEAMAGGRIEGGGSERRGGREGYSSLGLKLRHSLHPSQDTPQELNLRELFQKLPVGTDGNTPHAIYYDDPLQVSNSALRVATIVDKRRGLRLGCLDQVILRDLISRRIRRTDMGIQFDLPMYDDSKEACLRILMSSTGSVDSHMIRQETIDEYIIYHDGTCDMYVFTANTSKTITQRVELIESIIFPRGEIAYRPVQREIRAQMESGRRVPQNMRGKNDIISAKIKSTNITPLILKETDVDDPADDVIRFHYLLVNLPADVIPGKKFKLTNDSIQKRVNILLLNGSDLETIIGEMITEDITPGVLLEAIGKLPEGRSADSFRLLSMTTREVLMGALREYYNELDQDLAIRELGRLRENEGTDSMVGDVQVQNNRDGSLTTFVAGLPNMEALNIVEHLIGKIYEQFPVILETPPVSRPASIEPTSVKQPTPIPEPPRAGAPKDPTPVEAKALFPGVGEKEYKPPAPPEIEIPIAKEPTKEPTPIVMEEEVIKEPTPVEEEEEEIIEEEERATTPFSEAEEEEIIEEAPTEPTPIEEAPKEPTPIEEEEIIEEAPKEPTPIEEEEIIEEAPKEPTPIEEEASKEPTPIEEEAPKEPTPIEEEEGVRGNLGSPEEEFSGEVGSVVSAPEESIEGGEEEEEFAGFGRKQIGRGNGDGEPGTLGSSDGTKRRLASKEATAGILFDPSYTLKRLTGGSVIDTKRSTGKVRTSKTNVFGAIKDDFSGKSKYSITCQSNVQPIVITPEQLERYMTERPGSFGHYGMLKGEPDNAPGITRESMEKFVIDYKGFKFICPKYWSMIDETPLYSSEVDKKDDIYVKSIVNKDKNVEINTGKHVLRMHMANRRGDLDPDDPKDLYFPGFNVKGKPCCFFVGENTDKFESYYKARVLERQGGVRETEEVKEGEATEEAGAEAGAGAGEVRGDEAPIVPATTSVAPIRQRRLSTTILPTEVAIQSRLQETIGELQRGNVDEDTRWDTRKATYLIPEQEVIDLLGIAKSQCNAFLQKRIKEIEAVCIGRVPDVVDFRESLFRSVLLMYRFTVASLSKDASLLLTSSNDKDPLETFRQKLGEWVTPERFRNFQGGSLMRAFLPATRGDEEGRERPTKETIERWFRQWEETFPLKLREEFREQIDTGSISELLTNWAVAHRRFLEYLSSPDEPKLLRHFWEILTRWPWQLINETIGGKNAFSDGVNVIVIRATEPPMVLCPGEGALANYFRDGRPSVILLENQEGRYQPLVLISRERRGGKKFSLHVYGAILPDPDIYTSMAPATKTLIKTVWGSINRFPSQSRSLCEPEKITPISDAPEYMTLLRQVKEATGQSGGGFVIDNLGRLMGVVYKMLPAEQLLLFPVKSSVLDERLSASKLYIGEESIAGRFPTYRQAIVWLSELRSKLPTESPLQASLKTMKAVLGVAYTDESTDHIGYTINGIQLATNVIVPVQEPEIYTKETLESVMEIRLADAVVSAWDSEVNALLSSSSQSAPKVDDKLVRAIRETAIAILDNEELWETIRKIRNDRRLTRIQRLVGIRDAIPLEIIKEPEGFASFREKTVREQIRERITLAAARPNLLETIAKGVEVVGSVKFPPKTAEELQLTYAQILTLRESDLTILDSKFTTLVETFGIGGVPDPLYISPKAMTLPIPLQGVWRDEFHYDSDRTSAIQSRDNIKEIRMLPSSSSDPRISWESVAKIMREPLRNDRLDATGVLSILADGWAEIFRKLGALRSSDDAWIHLTDIFRKEAHPRGASETDYGSPELFLRSLRLGRFFPTLTDFFVLTNLTPTTFHIVLLHGYSTGEVLTDARYPMRVIGGAPERWKEGSYGILLQIPDKTAENDKTVYYSALLGMRTRGLAPFTSLSAPKNHLPGRVFKRIHSLTEAGSTKEWMNVRRVGWETAMFKKRE